MGERYEPERDFTVAALLGYNLTSHTTLITTVHQAAQAEYVVEQKLAKLKKMWDERTFKLAKHICDSIYKEDNNGKSFKFYYYIF